MPAYQKAVDGGGLLFVPVHGLEPAPMSRPSALPLTNDTYDTRRDKYIAIYITHAVRHTVMLYVPTTLCRCTKRRSMEREDMPVQVSWPAPTRRRAASPSLPIHIIHVATQSVLLYVPTTLCRCPKRRSMASDYMTAQASWPAPTRPPLARPSLTIQIINVAVHNEQCNNTAVPAH